MGGVCVPLGSRAILCPLTPLILSMSAPGARVPVAALEQLLATAYKKGHNDFPPGFPPEKIILDFATASPTSQHRKIPT